MENVPWFTVMEPPNPGLLTCKAAVPVPNFTTLRTPWAIKVLPLVVPVAFALKVMVVAVFPVIVALFGIFGPLMRWPMIRFDVSLTFVITLVLPVSPVTE